MTIDQIECFVAVASTGSISQAAARMYRSQPNLSHTIKMLETDLGYPLLHRSNQGVALTAEGAVFLRQAQRTLEDFQRLRNFSVVRDREVMPDLRLGAMPFCGVGRAMSVLMGRYQPPFHQIVVNQCMRDELISGLIDRRFDLGIAYAYPATAKAVQAQLETGGLVSREIAKCSPCALIGRGCSWFGNPPSRISTQQLRTLYRVFYARHGVISFSSTQFRSLSECAGQVLAGDQLDIQSALHTLPSFSLVPCSRALLQTGGTIMEGLRCIPIAGHDTVGAYYAIYRRQVPPSSLGEQLLEILRQLLEGAL